LTEFGIWNNFIYFYYLINCPIEVADYADLVPANISQNTDDQSQFDLVDKTIKT